MKDFDYEAQKREEAVMTQKQEALYAAINKKWENNSDIKHQSHAELRDMLKEMLKRRYVINDNQCAVNAINSEHKDRNGNVHLNREDRQMIRSYTRENVNHTIEIVNVMKSFDKICDKYNVEPVFNNEYDYNDALNRSAYMQNIITDNANEAIKKALEEEDVKQMIAEKETISKRNNRPLPHSYENVTVTKAMENMGAEFDE